MTSYVLGFAFDERGRVALIEKQKPEWQKGRYNGIGGKIEANEKCVPGASIGQVAMAREFEEETGVLIPPKDWIYVGRMRDEAQTWIVYVYVTKAASVANVTTKEQETVRLIRVDDEWLSNYRGYMIENVPALLELCQIEASGPSKVRPRFELTY